MDITPPGIDKAVGLSKLAQYLQIDKAKSWLVVMVIMI